MSKRGEIDYWRERWVTPQDEQNRHGHLERVDHRSLKDQGVEREPTHHPGPAIDAILARGDHSTLADRWPQEANERLRLGGGAVEREHLKTKESILDLLSNLAAAVRELQAGGAEDRGQNDRGHSRGGPDDDCTM